MAAVVVVAGAVVAGATAVVAGAVVVGRRNVHSLPKHTGHSWWVSMSARCGSPLETPPLC